MDFSFDSIAIVPELICLFIIPEYIRVIFPKNPFREGLGVGFFRYQPAVNHVTYTIDTR